MCTDEMTAGSVSATQRERRLLAAQSHAFNISQRRFSQLFPEYMGPVARDLPNMSRPSAVADHSGASAGGAPPAVAAGSTNMSTSERPPVSGGAAVPHARAAQEPPANAASPTPEAPSRAESAPSGGGAAPEPVWRGRNVVISVLVVLGCLFAAKVVEAWR